MVTVFLIMHKLTCARIARMIIEISDPENPLTIHHHVYDSDWDHKYDRKCDHINDREYNPKIIANAIMTMAMCTVVIDGSRSKICDGVLTW